jgi:hypothetical protein
MSISRILRQPAIAAINAHRLLAATALWSSTICPVSPCSGPPRRAAASSFHLAHYVTGGHRAWPMRCLELKTVSKILLRHAWPAPCSRFEPRSPRTMLPISLAPRVRRECARTGARASCSTNDVALWFLLATGQRLRDRNRSRNRVPVGLHYCFAPTTWSIDPRLSNSQEATSCRYALTSTDLAVGGTVMVPQYPR